MRHARVFLAARDLARAMRLLTELASPQEEKGVESIFADFSFPHNGFRGGASSLGAVAEGKCGSFELRHAEGRGVAGCVRENLVGARRIVHAGSERGSGAAEQVVS